MKKSSLIALLLSFLFFTTPIFSHSYHYELQVSNTFKTNNEKQLEALQLSFLYDGDVSDVMLQDEKDLDKLAKKLITDLEKLGYFTQIKLNDEVLNTQKASNVKLSKLATKSKDGDYDILKLSFTLKLKSPTPISKGTEIAFFHEDPTGAAILYYESADQIIVGDKLKNLCKVSVKEKDKFNEGEFPQIIRVHCQS